MRPHLTVEQRQLVLRLKAHGPYVDSSRCQGNGKGKDKCGARVAYSLKATGVRAPSRGLSRPAAEPRKDAA